MCNSDQFSQSERMWQYNQHVSFKVGVVYIWYSDGFQSSKGSIDQLWYQYFLSYFNKSALVILVKVQKGTMKLTSCWTIFFTLYISHLVCSSPVSELEQSQKLLHLTLKALRGALDFFDREFKNVNLDAVVGTRIVAGECYLFIYFSFLFFSFLLFITF